MNMNRILASFLHTMILRLKLDINLHQTKVLLESIYTCLYLHFGTNTHVHVPLQSPYQQYPSIGSDNGLAPARRQAIIWTNDN